MFEARAALHDRLYSRAAKLYLKGWEPSFVVPDTDGSRHLHRLVQDDFGEVDPDAQAERLRQARFDDATDLLALADVAGLPPAGLGTVADFAFRTGHYDVAERLYIQWAERAGDAADAEQLNSAAWHLYLTRRGLDEALAMARRAYELGPDGDVADTLARLLYVTGDVDTAVRLQKQAVERAGALVAASYSEALQHMEDGRELPDRPAFELYPAGAAEPQTAASSSSL
jgi:tetratricopeptide (TPR) repeat protein